MSADTPQVQPSVAAGPWPVLRDRLARVADAGEDEQLAPVAGRYATRVSVGALVLVALVSLAAPVVWQTAPWAALLLGLAVGLPHGAVDHLVPERLIGRRVPRTTQLLMLAGYGAVFLAFLAAVQLAPGPAIAFFLVVAVIHFGAGDEAFTALRAGRPARYNPLTVVGLGGAPILLPFALWPEQVRPVLDQLAPGLTGLLASTPRAVMVGVVLVGLAFTAVRALRLGDRRAAGEAALLPIVFAVVPPLPAFGAYFGLWHSLRHVSRLVSVDPGAQPDLAAGRIGRPLARFAKQAALPTLGAALVLGALWWGATGAMAFVAANIGLLAALTMPHMALASWMDAAVRLSGDRTPTAADAATSTG